MRKRLVFRLIPRCVTTQLLNYTRGLLQLIKLVDLDHNVPTQAKSAALPLI